MFFIVALFIWAGTSHATTTVFSIHGTHFLYGLYTGWLEIEPGRDGQLRAQRIVTFTDYRFEGFKVQEVWSGSGRDVNGSLHLKFRLKQADLFNKVDNVARTTAQFKNDIDLYYTISPEAKSLVHLSLPSGAYNETVASDPKMPSIAPIWHDRRILLKSYGSHDPIVGGLAMSTVFAPFMNRFRHDPQVAFYLRQPRCDSPDNFIIRDPTDFHFLRAHPDTIRVDNKVTDFISMVEASIRRDAYGPTLEQKQKFLDEDVRRFHLNQLGQYSSAKYDRAGNFAGYGADGDAALYTGMYAASQAMRYLAMSDPRALANFKAATQGLMLLMDVTGSPSEFARTARLLPAGGVTRGWARGIAPYQNVEYLPGGNNDMIKGLFLAFSFAFKIIPPNDPFLAQVATHAARLPELKVSNKLGSENYMLAHGLAAMATGRTAELLKYIAGFVTVIAPSDFLGISTGFFYGGIADWSGSNLLVVSKITRINIAESVLHRFGSLDSLGTTKAILLASRRALMKSWEVYKGSKRDTLTVAAATFGPKDRPAGFADSLAATAWSLNEVPVPRARHDISADFSLRPDWCMSYWPQMPWKSFTENNPMSRYYQSAYDYPFFELDFLNTDDFNKDGFNYRESGDLRSEQQGRVDFLFLYWMARMGRAIPSA